MKFIRKGGRIIPIGDKKGSGSKAQKQAGLQRRVEQGAGKGVMKGAQAGALAGATASAALGRPGFSSTVSVVGQKGGIGGELVRTITKTSWKPYKLGKFAVLGTAAGGLLGAAAGMLYGARKKR